MQPPYKEAYAVPVGSGVPMAEVVHGHVNNNEQQQHFPPPAPPPSAGVGVASPPPPVPQYDAQGTADFLRAHKWNAGLTDTFLRNLQRMPIRYIIADDSGSMVASDGHILMKDSLGNERLVGSSRWSELCEALRFHAGVARAANAPTEFRTLNSLAPILVGTADPEGLEYYRFLDFLKNSSPGGSTPLCKHVGEIVAKIRQLAPALRAANQRACVAIYSDGEATDGDLVEAMKPLQSLPVWVVVRLCTDEQRVVDLWNNLDTQLEISMDVLDDWRGESLEVFSGNPWLNYCEPIHRCREFGLELKEFDMLDSNLLSFEQLRSFCAFLYGGSVDSFPHPEISWSDFVSRVEAENDKLPKIWNPRTGQAENWISISKLKSAYGKSSCSIS
jgi:hypothetical protein